LEESGAGKVLNTLSIQSTVAPGTVPESPVNELSASVMQDVKHRKSHKIGMENSFFINKKSDKLHAILLNFIFVSEKYDHRETND